MTIFKVNLFLKTIIHSLNSLSFILPYFYYITPQEVTGTPIDPTNVLILDFAYEMVLGVFDVIVKIFWIV